MEGFELAFYWILSASAGSQNAPFLHLFAIALTVCVRHWGETARARGENWSFT